MLVENRRRTILLVEDDPLTAETMIAVLESSGYGVVHTGSGAEAKRTLEQVHPDLVVLDLGLPDEDGLILCTKLKAIEDVRVIICSASEQKRDRVLGLKLGADDFIAKPFDPDEFLARVEAVLRRKATPKVN